jgi:hypothetical protein
MLDCYAPALPRLPAAWLCLLGLHFPSTLLVSSRVVWVTSQHALTFLTIAILATKCPSLLQRDSVFTWPRDLGCPHGSSGRITQ